MAWILRPSGVAVVAVALLVVGNVAAQNDRREIRKSQNTVEVSPRQFITFLREDVLGASLFLDGTRDETTEVAIPWDGKTIRWKGFDIMVTLRAHEGRLYMIGWDRHTDFRKPVFHYYQQNRAGDGFERIEPAVFPRQIATQNMGFQDLDDDVDLALKLDPEHPRFCRSFTAMVWCQLQAGLEHHQTERMPEEERKAMLRKFKAEHRPSPLTRITPPASATRPATQPATP